MISGTRRCGELVSYERCSAQDLRLAGSSGDREHNSPRLYKGVFYRKKAKKWVAQITHPLGHCPRQEVVCQASTQKAAAEAMAARRRVKVGTLLMKKQQFYQGHQAMMCAKKKFKVLSKIFVKKPKLPGGEGVCLNSHQPGSSRDVC